MSNNIATLTGGYQIGKFEILQSLHRGGQATVYLARIMQSKKVSWQQLVQTLEQQDVTPELIDRHLLCVIKIANPGSEDHLHNEWEFLQHRGIRHERLIQTYAQRFGDVVSIRRGERNAPEYVDLANRRGEFVAQVPFIVLAYEPGGSLKQLFEDRNYMPLPPGCAVHIAIQIGEALHHLHEQGHLVHHDVTPSNILLRQRPRPLFGSPVDVILTDLAASESLDNPRLQTVFGKRLYLPVERLKNLEGSISPQIDIYSLGIVLYEMLSGRIKDQDTQELKDTGKQFEPLKNRAPVSDELNSLVMNAIERDVQRRARKLPTMQDMVEKLQAVPEAQKPRRLRGKWTRYDVRQWLTRVAIAVVVALAFLAVVWGVSMLNSDSGMGTGTTNEPTATSVGDGRAIDDATVTPLPSTPTVTATAPPVQQPSSTPIPEASYQLPPAVLVRSVSQN